jgi:hypothetical protein
MDPVDAATTTQQIQPALTAVLVTLAIGLMDIIKLLIGWMSKKFSKKDRDRHAQTLLVQLDPEVSAVVHETGDNVKDVSAIVSRVDADGMPLVYADRKMERTVEKIAILLDRISNTQERLSENMAKLESRFEEHSKQDVVTFARLADSHARIEEISSINHDTLIEVKQDNRHVFEVLQEIKNKLNK